MPKKNKIIGVDAGCLGVKDKRLKVGVYQAAFNLLKELARLDKDKQPVTWVDVKGTFSGAHGLAKFSIIQKWLLTNGTFIQKVVVSLDEKSIFAKTFTPRTIVSQEVYKKDCRYGKEGDSKLKYEPRLLEHYLRWRK